MKKIVLLLIVTIALVACNDSEVTAEQVSAQDAAYGAQNTPTPSANVPDEPQLPNPTPEIAISELEIQIAFADDEFINSFDNIRELDYSEVRLVRNGGYDDGLTDGDRLMIWANKPVSNFAVILIGNDDINDELIFFQLGSFGMTSELSPNEVFVINNYWGLGTLPWSGITYLDENGVIRYFTLQQSMQDGSWDFYEFENRVSELPDDWRPWWQVEDEIQDVLVEQTGISEYGRQVAIDFLMDFTTLLTNVIRAETTWDEERRISLATGRYILGWDNESQQLITTDEIPDISLSLTEEGYSAFFDNQGNIITDEPWVYPYSLHYANYFKLFDFDNDGIPEILMHFQQTFEGCYGGFYRIFKYIDGAYRMLEMAAFANGEQLTWINFGSVHNLFVDEDGRIITLIDSEMTGFEYTHLIFANNRVEFHHITMPEYTWEEWREHHWMVWEETVNGYEMTNSWVFHNTAIFGTDIAIKPLQPFTELGAAILEYLEKSR